MAFEYIGDLLEEAVRDVNPLETRGRVEQVVGTIIRAVVPGVKVGELCLLRNPWEDWSLKAEVGGFVRNVALRVCDRLHALPEAAVLPSLTEDERHELWRGVKKLLLKEVAPSWAPCFD